jgi:Uma2 family endonuclease
VVSDPYDEILEGEVNWRFGPNPRHEEICERLHWYLVPVLAHLLSSRLLEPRSLVTLAPQHQVRPDLALLTAATHKPWLLAEVVDFADHQTDTVIKKEIYGTVRLPRLWMIDPRYDNIEVYHGSAYGLTLKEILAGHDTLREPLLPGLEIKVSELFRESSPTAS